MILYDNDIFERGGRKFRFKTEWDQYSCETPWDREDGHGHVSGWTRRDKQPGERLLHEDHGSKRYYDFAGAIRIAKKDGWGLGEKNLAILERKLGRKPTRKQIVAEAVEQDFQRLYGWCHDRWNYIGIIVEEVESGERESLWGIESDCRDYHVDVADGLADEINARLNDAFVADVEASQPDMYAVPSIHSDGFWQQSSA